MPEPERDPNLAAAVKAIADAVEEEEGRMTARKRRIVESAIVCFARNGFEATTTSEIARRAEVAEGTIFRHFNSKKELLIRLVRPVAGRLLVPAALDELEHIRAEAGDEFRKIAEAVMASRIAFADRYAPLLRIVAQELPFQPELRAMLLTDSLTHAFAVLVETMGGLVKAGQIRADIPPDRMFRWFGSLIAGYYAIRSMLPPGTFDDRAEIAATVDFMIRGAGRESG